MLKIKCDINQQYLNRVDLHFVKSEWFSLTWSCGSRQRDTTSSGWKFKLNNLAVKGLIGAHLPLCKCTLLLLRWRVVQWVIGIFYELLYRKINVWVYNTKSVNWWMTKGINCHFIDGYEIDKQRTVNYHEWGPRHSHYFVSRMFCQTLWRWSSIRAIPCVYRTRSFTVHIIILICKPAQPDCIVICNLL